MPRLQNPGTKGPDAVLAAARKELSAARIAARKSRGEIPPRAEYAPAEKGRLSAHA